MFRSLCLALLILAGASPAFAGCQQTVFYAVPAVPSAQTSTYEQMATAVSNIKQYIANAERALEDCRTLSAFSFNYYVNRLHSLASAINTQSKLFLSINNS